MLIPISDGAKVKGDVAAVSGAALAYFQAIPWAELAAAASFLYMALRIIELAVTWVQRWRAK